MKRETVKSRRLIITPLSDGELEKAACAQNDRDMKKAYNEMLLGAKAHPESRVWYTEWKIETLSGEAVGGIGFKGPPDRNKNNFAVEIGYGIDEAFRCKGYATEAVLAMCDWAFSKEDCCLLSARRQKKATAPLFGCLQNVPLFGQVWGTRAFCGRKKNLSGINRMYCKNKRNSLGKI